MSLLFNMSNIQSTPSPYSMLRSCGTRTKRSGSTLTERPRKPSSSGRLPKWPIWLQGWAETFRSPRLMLNRHRSMQVHPKLHTILHQTQRSVQLRLPHSRQAFPVRDQLLVVYQQRRQRSIQANRRPWAKRQTCNRTCSKSSAIKVNISVYMI